MSRSSDTGSRFAGYAALLAVVALGAALIAYKVRIAIAVGPEWDTYAFLANAAEFAGKGYGYTEAHRPPLLSLITALFFRFGELDQATVQWVDGALSLSGLIAFYLLMRVRFDALPAAAGALGLLVVQPLWEYLGVGYTDFAAIALSIWLLLSIIKATEEHPAWYLASGALFVGAVMTRYTALLFAFPALVYLVLRWRPFRQARWILGGVGSALAAYTPAAVYYAGRFGDVLFPFVIALGLSEGVEAPAGEGQAAASGIWYLTHLPGSLAPAGFELLALLVLGIGALGVLRLAGDHMAAIGISPGPLLRAALGAAIAVAGQSGGLLARQLSILLAALIIYRALAPRDESTDGLAARVRVRYALDATMLVWFVTYLDFHGHQTIQVPRYFITMAASVLYFTVLGWSGWAGVLTELQQKLGAAREPSSGMRAAVMVVLSGFIIGLLTATAVTTDRTEDRYVAAAHDSSIAMLGRDPDIRGKAIYSDLWPLIAWYVRTDVRPMPAYEDLRGYGHELEKGAAEYFFTIRGRRFDSYEEVLRADSLVVLERTAAPAAGALPSVQYVGKSWDNYLEATTAYQFFLKSTAGRYGWEGSAFLDNLTLDELEAHDAVAVYNWRWKDRVDAEALLAQYVREGGSVVIDASQNLDGLAYSVAGTIIFDVFIGPGTLPADGDIEVRGSLAASHPGLGPIAASPFVDEIGGPWTGATYTARPGTERLETLATIGGRPVIQAKQVGKGTVYFVGYNLVWHAFSSDNYKERELMTALFADAIEASGR